MRDYLDVSAVSPSPWKQFTGASTLTIVNAASSAVAALLIARWLGVEDFGRYTFIVTIAAMMSLLGGLGTGIRLRLRAGKGARDQDFQAFTTFSYVATVAVGIVSSLLYLGVTPEGSPRDLTVSVLVFLYAALVLVAKQLVDAVQAMGALLRSLMSAVLSSLTLVGVGLIVVPIWGSKALTPSHILAFASLGLLTQAAFLIGTPNRPRLHSWPPSFAGARAFARDSWRGTGFLVGLNILQRSPRIIIISILGPATGGVYAISATLAETSRLLSGSMGQVLFLRVSGGTSDQGQAKSLRNASLAITFLVGVAVALAGPWFIKTAVGPDFHDSSAVLYILLMSELVLASAILDARVALARNAVTKVSRSSILSAIASGLMVVAGTLTFGLSGALIATAAGYVIYALSMRRVVKSTEKVDVQDL